MDANDVLFFGFFLGFFFVCPCQGNYLIEPEMLLRPPDDEKYCKVMGNKMGKEKH